MVRQLDFIDVPSLDQNFSNKVTFPPLPVVFYLRSLYPSHESSFFNSRTNTFVFCLNCPNVVKDMFRPNTQCRYITNQCQTKEKTFRTKVKERLNFHTNRKVESVTLSVHFRNTLFPFFFQLDITSSRRISLSQKGPREVSKRCKMFCYILLPIRY